MHTIVFWSKESDWQGVEICQDTGRSFGIFRIWIFYGQSALFTTSLSEKVDGNSAGRRSSLRHCAFTTTQAIAFVDTNWSRWRLEVLAVLPESSETVKLCKMSSKQHPSSQKKNTPSFLVIFISYTSGANDIGMTCNLESSSRYVLNGIPPTPTSFPGP